MTQNQIEIRNSLYLIKYNFYITIFKKIKKLDYCLTNATSHQHNINAKICERFSKNQIKSQITGQYSL